MIKDSLAIMDTLNDFASPKSKLTRMIRAGEWIQIRRGLYISQDDKTSPYLLAPMIYGPSYLSFEFALSYHGLIPESHL
jgi:predicted transcriptional regulator of viral defense system